MVNMLLTFAHRVRVATLLQALDTARSDEDLKALVDAWHEAIAESPNGIAEIDRLQSSLLEMLVLGERR